MPSEGEFVFGGLTLGGAGDYPITKVDGLDHPGVREDNIKRTIEHGAFIFGQYLPERRVTIEGFIIQSTTTLLRTKINSLKAAMVPSALIRELVFRQAGETVDQRIYCIPTKLSIPYDLDHTLGYAPFIAQFLAGDPRIYADALSTVNVSSGSGVANNAGNFPSFPDVTIVGPATNPKITLGSQFVQVLLTVPNGSTLTISFDNRTISLGNTSRYDALSTDSVWFDLEPGNSNLVYTGGGTATVSWRSAWL